jgi:hypothetical protein
LFENILIIRCSEKAKNLFLDIRDLDPKNGIIPEDYYKTGAEKQLLENYSLLGPRDKDVIRENNMTELIERNRSEKQPIMIDLTLD